MSSVTSDFPVITRTVLDKLGAQGVSLHFCVLGIIFILRAVWI